LRESVCRLRQICESGLCDDTAVRRGKTRAAFLKRSKGRFYHSKISNGTKKRISGIA
jgi:hypothetical protein